MAVTTGAEHDAALAEQMMRALIVEAELTLRQAVEEAPLETPASNERAHREYPPGHLRESARIVYLINEAGFDNAAAALAAVRSAALGRRLYRVDAELRFETPYARRQHDQITLRHETGKARFLEDPVKAARARLGASYRAAMVRVERGEWTHRLPGETSR